MKRSSLSLATIACLCLCVLPSTAAAQRPIPSDTRAQLDEANRDFKYRGSWINPLGIKLMLPWFSDKMASTTAIDVGATMPDTNQFIAKYEFANGGFVRVNLKCEQTKEEGFFDYRHIGRLANGMHVLEVRDNGGGTGVYCDLLLVRFALVPRYEDDGTVKQRLTLQLEGNFVLGDRFQGNIRIDGNKIMIGAGGFQDDQKPRTLVIR